MSALPRTALTGKVFAAAVGGLCLLSGAATARAQPALDPAAEATPASEPAEGRAAPPDASPSDASPSDVPPRDLPLPAVPPTVRPLVYLDWHGHVRVRGTGIDGVRLLTADGAPRLGLRHPGVAADNALLGEGRLGSADLRLRLEPTLYVGEWSRVQAQLDLADRLVLGANPASREAIAEATEVGQGPVPGGVRVRRLWLHARVFDFGKIELGRMGDHFGLGLVRNDGGDLLGDFQTDVDRVAIRTELFGLRWMVARDTVATLAVTQQPLDGPQVGLQDSSDVVRWVLQGGGGRLDRPRGLVWAAAFLYQTQDLGLRTEHEVSPDPALVGALVPRDFRQFTVQAFLDWRTAWGLRLQGEGALAYGSIGRTDHLLEKTDTSKTLIGAGIATRASIRTGRGEWRLDSGFASGESEGGFGVLDTDNFRRPGTEGELRPTLSGFRFHRNFRIDGLLFRELVGAVTNTVYGRPAFRWHLHEAGLDQGLSLEAAFLAAVAASSDATPGGQGLLGLEPEVVLDWRDGRRSAGQLRGTLLLPGGAFDTPGGVAAEPAWRVEAVWRLGF